MAFKRSAVRSRLSPPNLVPEAHRFRNFFVYKTIFSPPNLLFCRRFLRNIKIASQNTLIRVLHELTRVAKLQVFLATFFWFFWCDFISFRFISSCSVWQICSLLFDRLNVIQEVDSFLFVSKTPENTLFSGVFLRNYLIFYFSKNLFLTKITAIITTVIPTKAATHTNQ